MVDWLAGRLLMVVVVVVVKMFGYFRLLTGWQKL